MADRIPIRDRTLVLRVLVPGLEARLRDKMKEMEDMASSGGGANSNNSNNNNGDRNNNNKNNNEANADGGGSVKEHLLELDGVSCEPTADGSTLWNFHCDGATYPARLVNLPCPVELHKTHDHAMYYKSCDIAQMLIVYEDSMALDEADAYPKPEGFPSYYPHGLTPPLKRVVERRFASREHSPIAPPRDEIANVENDLLDLMAKISKEGGGSGSAKRTKVPALATAQHANKVLEEVEEVVVDYEPWMDDHGQQPRGVEFDADDQLCSLHPEIWLSPDTIKELEQQQQQKEAVERAEKAAEKKRKEMKKKSKKKDKQVEDTGPYTKKGIPSKKSIEAVDEVTQAAASMLTSEDILGAVVEDDDLFNFDNLDEDDMDFGDIAGADVGGTGGV